MPKPHSDGHAEGTLAVMLDLLAIDSPSGSESAIRADLTGRLCELGIAVESDNSGNIIGRMEATEGLRMEPAVLLNCHMDTVPGATGVRPVVADGVLRSDGDAALGADDKAGIAAILTALKILKNKKFRHGPITVIFTVAEESGLNGAKALNVDNLGTIGRGYTLDAEAPVGTAICSAPSKSDVRVVFHGKAAHAGFAPEKGISAISLAARAIDRMRLLRIDEETTANIGSIYGGEVTNIVCDRCEISLEARSSTQERVKRYLAHVESCCSSAANDFGGSYEFFSEELYSGYRIAQDAPEFRIFEPICTSTGLSYHSEPTGGGSDGNIFRAHGLPVITLGAGYENAHTSSESISIRELGKLTRLVTALCRPIGHTGV